MSSRFQVNDDDDGFRHRKQQRTLIFFFKSFSTMRRFNKIVKFMMTPNVNVVNDEHYTLMITNFFWPEMKDLPHWMLLKNNIKTWSSQAQVL